MARIAVRLKKGTILASAYVVGDVLGEGGSGTVYEGVRIADDEPVAIKVLHADLAGDRQLRSRFVRESVILRRLEGAHLCPLLDSGELPDPEGRGRTLLYMALARIPGRSLDRIIAERPLLSVTRACTIALGICYALGEAHAQGVIHRDLKPANVIVRPDDSVVAVDFGLAKIVAGDDGAITAITQHNMIFGTPEYMAPEQARGDELDARCDVYAAGVVLYELLTGRVPFEAATPLAVLTAHLTSDVLPIEDDDPERPIPAPLRDVVMRALAKDPGDRYATAALMARELRSLLDNGFAPAEATTRSAAASVVERMDSAQRRTIPDIGEDDTIPGLTPAERPHPSRGHLWLSIFVTTCIALALAAVGVALR